MEEGEGCISRWAFPRSMRLCRISPYNTNSLTIRFIAGSVVAFTCQIFRLYSHLQFATAPYHTEDKPRKSTVSTMEDGKYGECRPLTTPLNHRQSNNP